MNDLTEKQRLISALIYAKGKLNAYHEKHGEITDVPVVRHGELTRIIDECLQSDRATPFQTQNAQGGPGASFLPPFRGQARNPINM